MKDIGQTNLKALCKICAVCGKEFKVNKYRQNTALFCSRKCHSKSLAGRSYPNLRKRLNKKCIVCGNSFWVHLSREKNSPASFCSYKISDIKKFMPIFDLHEAAMIYKPLWDISNGITLCDKCHHEIHNYRPRSGGGIV